MEVILSLLRFVLLYFIIIFGSIFIAYKTNKKFEKCIAPTIAIIILVLYIFGMFELLKYGVLFISVISIILGIYASIKDFKNLKEKILTPGFIFFTIAFFILMFTSYRKNLIDYDHYFYRSLNSKTMYYHDTMSRGFLNLYTPATNLLQYFFMKVMGVYVQGIESFSLQMFGFALLLPLYDRIKNNKFMNFIITTIIICIPAILANLIFYESAYPDALLGLIIGYSIYMLYQEKSNRFKIFSVALMLSVMTLTKPIGFFISLIVIGMYLLSVLLCNRCNNKENLKKFFKSVEFKNIIILIIIIVITFTTWKIFTKIFNKYNDGNARSETITVTDNKITYLIKNILTTTIGYYEENHDAADSNEKLIPKIYAANAVMGPVRMPLYGAISVVVIAALIMYKYIIKDEDKKKYSNYIIALTVGLILYTILLQLSYILIFGREEMLDHAGLNRYLPTFILGMIYFIVAVAISNMEKDNRKKIDYMILIAVIISMTYLQSIANISITSGIYNIKSIEYCNNGRVPANKINEIIEEDKQIVIISQDEDTNLYNYMIRYYLYPEHKAYSYNELKENSIERVKTKIIEENISYLYVLTTDNLLNKLSYDNKLLKSKTLYKIEIIDKNIQLEEISTIV